MPTKKFAQLVPSFPDNVPVANVPTISLSKLEQDNPEESAKLFQASREYGFFSLDLSNSELGTALLGDVDTMLDLTVETLDLDKEVLKQWPFLPPKSLTG